MQYPLEIRFKIWTFAPTISVTNAQGNLVFYVRQKLFKLKEVINIFADEQRSQPLYEIKADRIIDFSARYHFSDSTGTYVGAVKRRGLKSIWRAHYDIFDGDTVVFTIQEENPWIKVLDALFEQIPVVGAFSGYVLHPKYLIARPSGGVVMRLEKLPAFWEGKYLIKQIDQLNDREEKQAVLSVLMMLLLERSRG
ncbi:MAG: hypothetical protein KME16_09285 [Scytolyngbya sp. HA4215-MV1]|jgi:hypothetical protein|nr:hypothetical protein [Scytolyngbya sp. HA4215-MV1]